MDEAKDNNYILSSVYSGYSEATKLFTVIYVDTCLIGKILCTRDLQDTVKWNLLFPRENSEGYADVYSCTCRIMVARVPILHFICEDLGMVNYQHQREILYDQIKPTSTMLIELGRINN
jgi:hypothetical protein